MKNIFLHIRNKISASYKADKQKWEARNGGDFNAYIKQGLVTLGIVAGVLLVLGLNDLYKTDKLSKYGVETYSTVYEVRYSARARSSSSYLTRCKFNIDGHDYFARYPLNRRLKYGDTLRVLYYPENPKINRLIVPGFLKTDDVLDSDD